MAIIKHEMLLHQTFTFRYAVFSYNLEFTLHLLRLFYFTLFIDHRPLSSMQVNTSAYEKAVLSVL